jgi:hypothetical protein
MQVGLAFELERKIVCTRVWWNGELEAVVGCGELGKAEPELVELPLTRPPGPRRPGPGWGDVSCGGALTAQTLTLPSAAPETRRMRSGVPYDVA